MSGQSTVLSVGAATIPASGSYTQAGLAQVRSFLDGLATSPGGATTVTFDPGNPVIPTVPAGQFGQFVLIVPDAVTQPVTLAVPSGYGAVILGRGTNATVTGGDPATRIVSGGVLDYTGAAMLVDASGGSGAIDDSLAGAVIEVGGGAYSVTASGAGAMVRIDNGGPGRVVAGDGAFLQLGGPGGADAGYPYAASVSGGTVRTGRGDQVTVDGSGFLIVDNAAGAGASTITALSGSSTVFAGTGDVYDGRLGLARTEFIGSGSAQTVFGGAANDTVFGQAGAIVYNQGSGGFSLFVAGSGEATVNAAGRGAVFDGTGHLLVNLDGSSDLLVGTNGGNETINAGGGDATVFGGSNEVVHLAGSHVAVVVPTGANSVLDAGAAGGTVDFFVVGAQGNVTLIGNVAAGIVDTYNIERAAPGHPQAIDIRDWHAGDGLFLGGFTANEIQGFDAAIDGGGGASIVLPDGTTIRFDGPHPTSAIGTVGF